MKDSNNILSNTAKRGIIIMADVLGYGSFMKNSDIGNNVWALLRMMNELPNEIKPMIETNLDDSQLDLTSLIKAIIKNIDYRVVSDTILVTYEVKTQKDKFKEYLQYLIVLHYAGCLNKAFLDFGLPLRGALSFGEFIFYKNSFAGKDILLNHISGESLKSAGIIVHEDVFESLSNYSKQYGLLHKDLVTTKKLSYRSKLGIANKGHFINSFLWYNNSGAKICYDVYELTKYLTNSFSKHNKSLDSDAAQERLDNTIKLYKKIFDEQAE